jgi:arylsulfatase
MTGHASLFTGRTVEEHGLLTADRKLRSGTTVFETLQEEGYETGVFSENVWITDLDIGLNQGFDTVVGPQNVPFPSALNPRRFVASEGQGQYDEFLRASLSHNQPLKSLANGIATKLYSDYPRLYPFDASAPGSVYLERFLDWQSERNGPWAACINFMDAHSPYEPDDEHNRWGTDELLTLQEERPKNWELLSDPSRHWMLKAIESLYDGTIRQLDSLMERLIRTLERRDALEDTLLVITSDHGEGFGEYSRVRPHVPVFGHNIALHEVMLHVPLLVQFPGQDDSKRVRGLTALTKFPDVVSDALDGIAQPDGFRVDKAYASSYGLHVDTQLRSRVERFQDPDALEGFNERMRAVYTDAGETVRKEVAWENKAAKRLTIRDAQTSYVIETISPTVVDEQFEGLSDMGLTVEGPGMAAVDDSVEDRLEELGYL